MRSTKTSTTGTVTHDGTVGLMLNYYNLNVPFSAHVVGTAALTRFSDVTIQYDIDMSARYYLGPVILSAGADVDVTDLQNVRSQIYGKFGVKF